jgi:hypothetical protein
VNNPNGSDSDPLVGSLTVSGGSTLVADTIRQASLTINGNSMVQISDKRPNNTGHTPSSTLYLNQLIIPQNLTNGQPNGTYAGTLDLTDNDMIISYNNSGSDPFQSILGMVTAGCDGGNWDGTGITSSEAQAGALFGTVGVAVVDNQDVGDANFDGVTLSQNEILVKYTWYGDTDVNGTVGTNELDWFLTGFYAGPGSADPVNGALVANEWLYGDFDYSGTISTNELDLFLTGFYGEGATTPMPEPGTLALLALGGLALLRRRSSRGKSGH